MQYIRIGGTLRHTLLKWFTLWWWWVRRSIFSSRWGYP